MALPQTSIESAPGLGYEGTLATGDEHSTWPRKNKSGAAIPFGRFLTRDLANPECIKLPSALTDKIVGVSLYEPAIEQDANGLRRYADKTVVSLCVQGTVVLIPEQDVVPGDAVFARCTVDGGDATLTPGRFRKDNAGASAGTKQKSKLTLSGALDGGTRRIQKLVIAADLDAGDTVDGAINGQAIAQVTFANSQDFTFQQVKAAILEAAAIWAEANGAPNPIDKVEVLGATNREIHIFSSQPGPATCALTAFATGGGAATNFTSATGADVLAGANPHELQARLHGNTLYKAAWAGTHDDTVQQFADQLRGDAAVGAVTVTVVPGTEDLLIFIEAAAVGANPILIDQNQVNGGAVARTLVADETIAVGAAAVDGKAILVDRAEVMTAALAGKPCWVRLNF